MVEFDMHQLDKDRDQMEVEMGSDEAKEDMAQVGGDKDQIEAEKEKEDRSQRVKFQFGRKQFGRGQFRRCQFGRGQGGRDQKIQGEQVTEEDGVYLVPLKSVVTSEKYVCSLCGYTACSKSNLSRHSDAMHSDSMTNCPRPYCKQVFQTKFMMKKHLSDCFLRCNWDDCDKKYKNTSRYESHLRAHKKNIQRLI